MTKFKEWLWKKEPKYQDYSAWSAAEREREERLAKNAITVKVNNIEIQGDKNFVNKTKSALTLLSRSKTFQEIKKYLGKIKQSNKMVMIPWKKPPTCEVGPDDMATTKLYAAALAHEAYHSYLYHNNQEYAGKNAEEKCVNTEIKVLEELGLGIIGRIQRNYLKGLKPKDDVRDPWGTADHAAFKKWQDEQEVIRANKEQTKYQGQ
jgi:hypothetical protein